MEKTELLACPFCGGEATLKQHKSAIDKNDRPIGGWFVDCEECKCGTPWHNAPEEAVAAWNHRAEPANEPLTCDGCRHADSYPSMYPCNMCRRNEDMLSDCYAEED